MATDGLALFKGIAFVDKAFISTTTNKAFALRWANQVRHGEEASKYKGLADDESLKQYKFHTRRNRSANISGAHVLTMKLPQGTRAMFTDTMYTRGDRPRGQDEVTVDSGYS